MSNTEALFCILALTTSEIFYNKFKKYIFIHVHMMLAWIPDSAVSLDLVLPFAPYD